MPKQADYWRTGASRFPIKLNGTSRPVIDDGRLISRPFADSTQNAILIQNGDTRIDSDIRIAFDCRAGSPAIFTRGGGLLSASIEALEQVVLPSLEDFSVSVDRVSPGFESMSGNYLSPPYHPPYRPPLSVREAVRRFDPRRNFINRL